MIQKHSTSKLATKFKFKFKTNQQIVATKIMVCFRCLKTKCEKCTMECIQNERSLEHRNKQTELEI